MAKSKVDEPVIPAGTPGPDGVIRGKGNYPGWKPLKTGWDGRWHPTKHNTKIEHRRPLASHEGYQTNAEWGALRSKQATEAQRYIRTDSEAQAMAERAAREDWCAALVEFVCEWGRLPSLGEEQGLRLVAQDNANFDWLHPEGMPIAPLKGVYEGGCRWDSIGQTVGPQRHWQKVWDARERGAAYWCGLIADKPHEIGYGPPLDW